MPSAVQLYDQPFTALDDKTHAHLIAEAFERQVEHYPVMVDMATQPA